ncbi:MAG TPA: enoyl-CoA hydratase-related protein [Vicinamibacterales bacterium]|nr:enoyl-CoA hydratase-related protein [Vicinamibacterales bacterium]
MLDIRDDGPVARLVLNRPELRNAFDDALVMRVTEAARGLAEDGRARVVVLEGAGPVFCAGADLNWMSRMMAYSSDENILDASRLAIMFQTLNTLPLPVIARVQGAALGGGAGLAAVADIVVADDEAVFGFTEVKLGILPAVISPYVLAKIGSSAARELFLTGARFSAARAKEIGLAHYVVKAGDLDVEVTRLTRELLSSGPGAMAVVKELVRRIACEPPDDVIGLTSGAIARQRVSPEGQEGIRAFLEKRRPDWAR